MKLSRKTNCGTGLTDNGLTSLSMRFLDLFRGISLTQKVCAPSHGGDLSTGRGKPDDTNDSQPNGGKLNPIAGSKIGHPKSAALSLSGRCN